MASDIKEAMQTASRLITDMRSELVRTFNNVLSQMLAGMGRIMPDKRTQFDMWKEAVEAMRNSEAYILSMIGFLQVPSDANGNREHADWALSGNAALFHSAASNQNGAVSGDVAQIFGELSHRFNGYSDKTKQNLWSFVSLLTTYAIKYCELISTPPEAIEVGLAQAMQAMPKWQDDFVRQNGRQPTLAEVQQFSIQLLSKPRSEPQQEQQAE